MNRVTGLELEHQRDGGTHTFTHASPNGAVDRGCAKHRAGHPVIVLCDDEGEFTRSVRTKSSDLYHARNDPPHSVLSL